LARHEGKAMQVFKVLTIIKVEVICIQSESGLRQPMKAKVGLTCERNPTITERFMLDQLPRGFLLLYVAQSYLLKGTYP
jgi:hypothetical protein